MKVNRELLLITQAEPSEVARAMELRVAHGDTEHLHIPAANVATIPRPDFQAETGFSLWRALAGLLRLGRPSPTRRTVELALRHAQANEAAEVVFISQHQSPRSYAGTLAMASRENAQQPDSHKSSNRT